MTGGQTFDFKVSDKVFSELDMEKLVGLLVQLYKKRPTNPYQQQLQIKIKASDGIRHELNEKNAKIAKVLFSEKKIESFEATYIDLRNNSVFSLNLHENKYGLTYGLVKSDNDTWFNATRSKIKDYLDSVQNQDNFYLRHKVLMKYVFSYLTGLPFTYFYVLIITSITTYFLDDSVKPIHVSPEIVFLLNTVVFILYFVIFPYFWGRILFYNKFRILIEGLWPQIEFNFGPGHLNKIAQKRKVINYCISVIGIQVVISVFFFIASKF